MIPVPIEHVDVAALRALIANEVREGKTIEYKLEMPGTANSDVVPLVATVSSFANTAGGDLLIGVDAIDGLPRQMPGVEIDNLDKELLRIEQILRSGIEPRLPHVDIRPISVDDGRYVWVIRVLDSWISPHRVSRNSKFYARNSAGRYELDVGDLRTAFTMSETLVARIRDFRADRIARIFGDQAPVPLNPGGCMVMHVLPLGAFLANATIDIASYEGSTHRLRPMGASGWDSRINLDGLLTFTGGGQKTSRAYTQVFRTGVVESVCVLSTYEGRMNLPSVAYEEDVIQVLTNYFAFVDEFEIDPPYYVFLSFVGVRGCRFGVGREYWTSDDAQVLRQETMILPEVVIQNRDDQPHEVLRPVFDTVWNAFGFRRSDNYDEQGNWIGR